MGTELSISSVAIPEYLVKRQQDAMPSATMQAALAGATGGGAGGPKISIRGSRFRLVEGETEVVLNSLTLEAIIVGVNPKVSKQFYEGAFDPDAEPTAPDCWSNDGDYPDATAENKQGESCATCPKNVWGSRITPQGKESKACSDIRRLAIVASDAPYGSIYALAVTPSALTPFNAYLRDLAKRNIDIETVVTRIGFDTIASYPKLTFSFGGFISPDAYTVVQRRIETGDPKAATGELNIPHMAAAKGLLPPPPSPLQGNLPLSAPLEQEKPKASRGRPKVETIPTVPPPVATGFGAATPADNGFSDKPAQVVPPAAQQNQSTLVADLQRQLEELLSGGKKDDE